MSANISYLTDIMQCFHSWQKVPNPQYFMRTPPYILPTPLSQILSTPPPLPHQHPNHCSFYCLWLNRWSCQIWCVILLNDIMDLLMSSQGNLVPEEPCWVFYNTCGFIASTLVGYHTHSYKQRQTAHTGAKRLTHPYKCISAPPAMCSKQLSELHWINNNHSLITFTWQGSNSGTKVDSQKKSEQSKEKSWPSTKKILGFVNEWTHVFVIHTAINKNVF